MEQKGEKSNLLGSDSEPTREEGKGARPKVRNPKEAKKRRFVMKQTKAPATPPHLESVSETEEAQTLLPKEREQAKASGKCPEFFGVRSYVHTFYEAMAMDNPESYRDPRGGQHALFLPARKRRKQLLCWRVTLVSGLMLLGMGLIAILVGFLVPKRPEVVGFQEDIEIIDRSNQAFNQDLDICKIVGIVLFCSGGSMATAILLVFMLVRRNRIEEPLCTEEIPLGVEPGSPIDVRVPATEELTVVQPKRLDSDEVVMTNAGLCKIPP